MKGRLASVNDDQRTNSGAKVLIAVREILPVKTVGVFGLVESAFRVVFDYRCGTLPSCVVMSGSVRHDGDASEHSPVSSSAVKVQANRINSTDHVAWKFEDGKPLGSRNTPQHWATIGWPLCLVYTRGNSGNGYIMRNRAPLHIALVAPSVSM